jgi:hypothetical protein
MEAENSRRDIARYVCYCHDQHFAVAGLWNTYTQFFNDIY